MHVHIIGGGVVGLCTAWYLRQAGCDVTVVDKSDLSGGCSHGNAGMIVPSHFVPLAAPGVVSQGIRWMFSAKSPFYIRPRLSLELVEWLWQFYRACTAEQVRRAMPVLRDFHYYSQEMYAHLSQLPDFQFDLEHRGLLLLCKNSSTLREEAEVAEQAHTLGIAAQVLSAEAVQALESNIRLQIAGGVYYPGDGHLYPDKFMAQMKAALLQRGVRLLTGCAVTALQADANRIRQLVLDNGDTIATEQVVLAAGAWSAKLLKTLGIRCLMQDGKGYSITLRQLTPKPTYPTILTEARVAITPMGHDLRIGGTLEISNLSSRINRARLAGILEALPRYYPDFQVDMPSLQAVWHGFRPCSPDGLPYIGRSRRFANLTFATGHAMMGMSLGPGTGRVVADILMNQAPEVNLQLFEPERFTLFQR